MLTVLGGKYRCFKDPYPSRPKWMPKATFEWRVASLESAIERYFRQLVREISRIHGG